MKRIKKILSITLLFVTILSNIVPIFADDKDGWPYYNEEISSKAAVVMDADSSKMLYSYNQDERLYPASLAKIMTAIIVFDYVKGNYDSLVNFSYTAVTKDIDRNSVTIGASAGDQLSIKDCLYSLLLPSANDVANALAEYVAGSINDFVLLMNEKVENLGLKNTHFVNPSGLHDDNQYTTAYDMAKILQYAMTYPIFYQISSSISYRHAPIRRFKNPDNSNNQVLNTNSIMVPGSGYYYNGATSGKTGHTKLAGYNLAASARKNDMNLICVVLGASSDKIRFNETKKLFDFHFDNYKSLSIKKFDKRFSDSISNISINDVNLIEALNITCNENAHITLPKNIDENKVTSEISFQIDDPYNPYAIGSITYHLNNILVGKCTLEGRNFKEIESIYTVYLNLSKALEEKTDTSVTNNTITQKNPTSALIYRNNNGNLVISNTLVTVFLIVIIFILIIAISSFLYVKVLSNTNIQINKFLFRLRRKLKS